ncbi:hypothetical protein QBC37DRAFT_113591 [Rhypophila decipiens]|uniref:Uncharacterized protein n=1 Tax=Rhypophila decipiens TaxID=261697 RepID=A0AAN6YDB5_9PEZI|nr:hypothetical protein QBC37DRAFT_113591 [Rhypophila decipiens]
MSDRRSRSRVAHVEEADDDGNVIEGTTSYAESVFAPSVASPSKEREIPNTGRTRNHRRNSISPTSGLTDSDSTLHPHGESLRSRDERRFSRDKKAMVPSNFRPPVKHAKTSPVVPKEAAYYGVTPPQVQHGPPPGHRPRSHTARPPSVYTNSRPPAANTRWYQNQGPPPPQQPGSYPTQSWGAPSPYPVPSPYMPPPSPGPMVSQSPVDYFSQSRPLESRFGTSAGARPQSSIGFRPPARPIGFDDYPEPDDMAGRRSSRRFSRQEELRGSMAPPPRPASARPVSLAIRPPPGTPARRAPAVFDEDDLLGESDLFRDISPRQAPYEQLPPMPIRGKSRTRRPSSTVYDVGPNYRTEVAVAPGRGGRRQSYYGDQDSIPGSYEDKLNLASRYQDEVTGGNPGAGMQLTAERLRKASSRHGGSRSSTRSSESRDESDFRQSATTRTTRSSAAGEEDMTIRVKGNAVLEVGGAKIRCRDNHDGAEINISRGPPAGGGYRTSSDQSSYLGQEDRRTRMDRPATRHRASSQAASFSRSMSKYDASQGYFPQSSPYEVPPPYPEYPAYPSVFPRPRDPTPRDNYF